MKWENGGFFVCLFVVWAVRRYPSHSALSSSRRLEMTHFAIIDVGVSSSVLRFEFSSDFDQLTVRDERRIAKKRASSSQEERETCTTYETTVVQLRISVLARQVDLRMRATRTSTSSGNSRTNRIVWRRERHDDDHSTSVHMSYRSGHRVHLEALPFRRTICEDGYRSCKRAEYVACCVC